MLAFAFSGALALARPLLLVCVVVECTSCVSRRCGKSVLPLTGQYYSVPIGLLCTAVSRNNALKGRSKTQWEYDHINMALIVGALALVPSYHPFDGFIEVNRSFHLRKCIYQDAFCYWAVFLATIILQLLQLLVPYYKQYLVVSIRRLPLTPPSAGFPAPTSARFAVSRPVPTLW